MLSSFSQKGMIEGEHMQEWFDSVGKKFVLAFVEGDRWKLYFKGLGVTLEIALFAAILGMVIGTVVALMRLSQKRNGKKDDLGEDRRYLCGCYQGNPVSITASDHVVHRHEEFTERCTGGQPFLWNQQWSLCF